MKKLKRACLFLVGIILLILSVGGFFVFKDRRVEPIVETKKEMKQSTNKEKTTLSSSFKYVETSPTNSDRQESQANDENNNDYEKRLNDEKISLQEDAEQENYEPENQRSEPKVELEPNNEKPQKQNSPQEKEVISRNGAFEIAAHSVAGNKVMWNGEDDEFYYFDAYEDMGTHYSIVKTIKVDKVSWVAHISEVG